jgi:hypothetical protein
MKRLTLIILCIVLMTGTIVSAKKWPWKQDDTLDGREVYLKYNLRFDPGQKKASCVNHQNGLIVPAGSKIQVISYTGKAIFILLEDGTEVRVDYNYKFTGLTPMNWIEKVTSPTDPMAGWKQKFTKLEWKGIKSGKALRNMRKDAVLVALGYPPVHKTASLEADTWVYWANRYTTFNVGFAKGKVIRIGSAGR